MTALIKRKRKGSLPEVGSTRTFRKVEVSIIGGKFEMLTGEVKLIELNALEVRRLFRIRRFHKWEITKARDKRLVSKQFYHPA